MKRKYFVGIVFICFALVVGTLIGIKSYKDKKAKIRIQEELNQKKLLEEENLKKIANIDSKLEFFKNALVIEEPKDELEEYLNNLILASNEINELSYSEIKIDDLKNIDNTKKNMENSLNISYDVFDKKIEDFIEDYSNIEKEEIIKIYNESSVVENKDELIKKVNDYKDKINRELKFVQFLENNKDKYYVKSSKVIYKSDEFKNEFLNYNINFEFEKEVLGDVSILMYHGVRDDAWGDTSLFVRVSEFESQMKYLSENGYTPIFLSEFGKAFNYQKPVLITFDDGYTDVYQNAFPILKKYNFKSNFYIITGWVSGDVFVTPEMIKEMDASGLVEIGAHTVNHVKLAKLDETAVDTELRESKAYLENLLGKSINTIAYPFGSYNSMVVRVARNYYDYAVTVVSGFENSSNPNKLVLKRFKVSRGCSLDNFKKYLVGE